MACAAVAGDGNGSSCVCLVVHAKLRCKAHVAPEAAPPPSLLDEVSPLIRMERRSTRSSGPAMRSRLLEKIREFDAQQKGTVSPRFPAGTRRPPRSPDPTRAEPCTARVCRTLRRCRPSSCASRSGLDIDGSRMCPARDCRCLAFGNSCFSVGVLGDRIHGLSTF